MKASKVITVFITSIFLLSFVLSFTSASEAASTTTATLSVNKLDVREKASIYSKKVDSLKKGTKSGWSEIRYKKLR